MSKIIKYWGSPGTGKTTKLISEINELLENGYKKDDFVITTYARSMVNDIKEKLRWDTDEGKINTTHGLCRGLAGIGNVVDGKLQNDFCNHMKFSFDNDFTETDDIVSIQTAKNTIGNLFFDARSFLVNNMFSSKKIYQWPQIRMLEKLVPDPESFMIETTKIYQSWKEERDIYDFGDMVQIVFDQKLMLSAKILIVDEFQDLTPIQNAIISMWENDMEMVILAGDPRQTIYSFTGADMRFFEVHPGEMRILDTTHRLPSNIWNFARKIVGRVNLSTPEIKTTNKHGVLMNITKSKYYESISLFQKDTLHLVRTNNQGGTIAEILINSGIPFRGLSGWSESQVHIYNAIVKIRGGLSGEPVILSPMEITNLIKIYPTRKGMFTKTKEDIINLRRGMYLDELRKYVTPLLLTQIESNNIFSGCLDGYGDETSSSHRKITIALKLYGKLIEQNRIVVLTTIHKAKGGEANFVFLHDELVRIISDNIQDNFSAAEEEARVFYVGATRARQALYIVNSDSKYRYALPDIPKANDVTVGA